MEKNIFEGAKFGDKFLTDDNRIAKFICVTKLTENTRYCLYVDQEQVPIWYDETGNCLPSKKELNIVSRCQETIDDDKLDEIYEEYSSFYVHGRCAVESAWVIIEKNAFIAGFRRGEMEK